MDAEARHYFAALLTDYPPHGRVLEVGALNVNGSIRDMFDGCEYVAMDNRDGPGVDLVADAHHVPFAGRQFHWVVSTSHLEHDEAPWLSAAEMVRVLRPRGRLAVTVPGFGWPRHDHPSDYWRFSPEGLCRLFEAELQGVQTAETKGSAGPMVTLTGTKAPR